MKSVNELIDKIVEYLEVLISISRQKKLIGHCFNMITLISDSVKNTLVNEKNIKLLKYVVKLISVALLKLASNSR